MPFSPQEKLDINEMFIKNNYNKRRAREEYEARYAGERTIPSLNSFYYIYKQNKNNISFNRKKPVFMESENNENDELDIILYFNGKLRIAA